MEPSSVEDGNLLEYLGPIEPEELQWSRPQLRTETGSGRCADRPEAAASMEPSSVEDGNVWPYWHAGASGDASMEPSSVEDGNGDDDLSIYLDYAGFNGAVLS